MGESPGINCWTGVNEKKDKKKIVGLDRENHTNL